MGKKHYLCIQKSKDSPRIKLIGNYMTHSYQYAAFLSHSKRHLNACFVHRLKKLCGRVFNLHVSETFTNDNDFGEAYGDFVTIVNKHNRKDAKDAILALCRNYGIGSDYIDIFEDFDGNGNEAIQIYLSQPKPSVED